VNSSLQRRTDPGQPDGTVARPKTDKTLAKALPTNMIGALLIALDDDAAYDERHDAWGIH